MVRDKESTGEAASVRARLTQEAEQDVDEAVAWYDQKSTTLADEFLRRDPALGVFPGLKFFSARFERLHTPLNLDGPGSRSVGIGWTVKASKEFGGELGAGFYVELLGVGEYGFGGLCHGSILRSMVGATRWLPRGLRGSAA